MRLKQLGMSYRLAGNHFEMLEVEANSGVDRAR
jgi:hypothetical protein